MLVLVGLIILLIWLIYKIVFIWIVKIIWIKSNFSEVIIGDGMKYWLRMYIGIM